MWDVFGFSIWIIKDATEETWIESDKKAFDLDCKAKDLKIPPKNFIE